MANARTFDEYVNSTTVESIKHREFNLVVNCGVPAVKWLANKDPETDRANIQRLCDILGTIKAKRFVQISTIDVFSVPDGQTEADIPSKEGLHAYGLHRLELEEFVTAHFPNTHIVRLAGLFGKGLKKNAIFDLLNDNCLDAINPAAVMQWYSMRRLSSDLDVTLREGLKLVHLAPAPLKTQEIISRFFPNTTVGTPVAPAPYYNFCTQYAAQFGGEGCYIMDQQSVLNEIGAFVADYA